MSIDEADLSVEWYDSVVFDDDWFGTVDTDASETHVLATGRFAYTAVVANAREFSDITNPYGHVPAFARDCATVTRVVGQNVPTPDRYATLFVLSVVSRYGLLRSPWNTNPVPYLMRSRYTFGELGGGLSYPGCQDFGNALGEETLAKYFSQLDGQLHGQLHVMFGGYWGYDSKWDPVEAIWAGSNVLLCAKFLWRQVVAPRVG